MILVVCAVILSLLTDLLRLMIEWEAISVFILAISVLIIGSLIVVASEISVMRARKPWLKDTTATMISIQRLFGNSPAGAPVLTLIKAYLGS